MTAVHTESGEKIIRIVHYHWIVFVGPAIVYLFLMATAILLFILAGMGAHHYMWLSHGTFIAALLLMLLTHHWFFAMLLSDRAEHIVITNKRVIHIENSLFFFDEVREISFEKMKTVEATKEGFFPTLLRYGTLHFEGSNFSIPYVPHTNSVAADIERAMGLR